MATNTLGRNYNFLRLSKNQARRAQLVAAPQRSSVVVHVASLSPPGPRGHDAAPDASPAYGAEHAANLERIASSGFATPSDSSPSSSQRANRSSAGNGAGGRAGGGGRSSVAARGGRSRLNRNQDLEPRGFTSLLSSAESLEELKEFLDYGLEKQALNDIHLSTAWSRLAKLVAQDTEEGQRPLQQQQQKQQPTSADGSAGSSSSSSSSSNPPHPAPPVASRHSRRLKRIDPAALAALVQSLEAATTPWQLGMMQARSLATVIWAAAKITYLTSENASGGGSAPAVGAAATAATAADTKDGAAESAEGDAEAQERPRPLRVRGGRKALEAAKAAAAEAAAAAAAQRTRMVSQTFLDAWAAAADGKLSTFKMLDISNVVWALGRLNFEPQGLFMRRLTVALLKELPRADRPQQLSNTLLGFALLRYVPPVKDFFDPVWAALNRLVLAEQKSPDVQAVSNSLWSLAQLSEHCPGLMPDVPPDVVSKSVFRAVQWGGHMNGTQVQDVLTSLPTLGFEPSDYQAVKLWQLAERAVPTADGPALSNVLMSLLQIRARPRTQLRKAILAAFQAKLNETSLESVARVLYCLGIMRVQAQWMPLIWRRLRKSADELSATDIAFTATAIRRLYPEVLPPHMRPATPAASVDEDEDSGDDEGDGQTDADATASVSAEAAEAGSEAAAAGQDPTAEAGAKAGTRRAKVSDGVPTGRVLRMLQEAWERLGPEAKLSVVFDLRANTQEFLDAVPEYVAEQERAEQEARKAAKAMAAAKTAAVRAVRAARAARAAVAAAEAASAEAGQAVQAGSEAVVAQAKPADQAAREGAAEAVAGAAA